MPKSRLFHLAFIFLIAISLLAGGKALQHA